MSVNLELEKQIIRLIELFNKKSFNEVIDKGSELFKVNKNIGILPNLIGAAYAGINEHEKAIPYYKSALKIDTNNKEVLNNLGKSQMSINLFDDAIISFTKSLNIEQKNFDTNFNLGIAYYKKKHFDLSIQYYLNAIKINNKIDKVFYNIGITFSKIGKNKDAKFYLKETLKLNQYHIKALNNLATIYVYENKYDTAQGYLQEAIKIDSKYSKAYNNLGTIYLQKKDYESALKNFTIAYDLDNNLVVAGVQKYFLKRSFCDWSGKEELNKILQSTLDEDQDISPWFCLSLEDNSKNHFLRAKQFSSKFNLLKDNKNIYSNKKIIVGYYAGDFHQHPGMINMCGIFKNHNKNDFETIGFYYGDIKLDDTHKKVKKYFDKFYYVNELDDNDIRDLSIKNKVDIAIYRAGLTVNARSSIFSHKVAPIQINFLGYQGTTGQEGIDYIICDQFVIPKEQEEFYTEKKIFLDCSYFPRDNTRQTSSKKFNKKDLNIPEESFVFCSFNSSYKITEDEFDIWMSLLKRVNNSYLILLFFNDKMHKNIINEAKKYDISSDKIIFLEKINYEDHLARHSLVDLFLDSFFYNAHTTAVDALWTCTPIITKVGKSFSSRVCGSLLNYCKLNELMVYSNNDYFTKALELAQNKKLYTSIVRKIIKAKNSGQFFDTEKYTKTLENAYKKVHNMRINKEEFKNVYIKDS